MMLPVISPMGVGPSNYEVLPATPAPTPPAIHVTANGMPSLDSRLKLECKTEMTEGEETPVIIVSIHGKMHIVSCVGKGNSTLFLFRDEAAGSKTPRTYYELEAK